jgi:hypothetical protein
MGEMRNEYKSLIGRRKGRDHLENQGTDGAIVLKWIIKK